MKKKRCRLSDKQKDLIYKKVKAGTPPVEVAAEVGCHVNTIYAIMKKKALMKKKAPTLLVATSEAHVDDWTKPRMSLVDPPAELSKRLNGEHQTPLDTANEENAYLRWVTSGLLNKVRGSSYLDRLLIDLKEDTLG